MSELRLAVVFAKRAAGEIEKASEWWRANREAAPDAIVEELSSAIELISLQPGVGALARSRRLAGVRRLLLPRVSYFLYYRVRPELRRVDILAFWHTGRENPPKL